MIPGWLDEIEDEVVSCLSRRGSMSARELASALGISEVSAVSYIHLLATEGRLTIEEVALPPGREGPRGFEGPPGREGASEAEVNDGVFA